MKNYEWIVFDADETLFHFDAFSGLQLMFSDFGVTFTLQDYHEYQVVNKPLWVDYQNGEITAQQLQHQRFSTWADHLQVSTQQLNSAFLSSMAEICTPLTGAISLLDTIKGKARLGIITNGFSELQQIRIERTGLKDYFDFVVISEQVGIAKPHRDIFDHALAIMGNPPRECVLMVGDNPGSDILGGINAGLDTCWLNADNKPTPEGINPHYQVASLSELESLLITKLGSPETLQSCT
ncbi:pyrimidine 5'-nucleotidase [Endozoicomonas sp. SM1973]|uniref:Pyrimidine 5'-nucleotidase n=1 Tax=Spartinivicinus marinus TaxID=2994442 RepID=A0A853IF44_9GAMM|nr:pyrimidine 5'-nucleotidase [Spartinivicinus marinus]MCX4026417.1 pyrimidine 5'-nucleotidase [Spartinivicinus marinus]NYZ69158.1 pyrimidine 5'-nucleotidase [Spartinivicinus marinus]